MYNLKQKLDQYKLQDYIQKKLTFLRICSSTKQSYRMGFTNKVLYSHAATHSLQFSIISKPEIKFLMKIEIQKKEDVFFSFFGTGQNLGNRVILEMLTGGGGMC